MLYFIVVFAVVFIATALAARSSKMAVNNVLLFSMLLIFIFSAFRIGFTPDYETYEPDFENPDSAMKNIKHENEGLYLLMVRYLTYRWALILQAFLLCFCLYLTFKKYIPPLYRAYGFIIFFFCTSFFLGNLSGFRSSFVTIGLFLAFLLKNKSKKGWILGALLLIASSFIHQSARLLIPLFLLLPSKPINGTRFKILTLLSLIIIGLSFLGANILNTFAFKFIQYFEEYELYMQNEISNSIKIGYFTILRMFLLLFLFFYSFNFCRKGLPGEECLFVKLTAIFFLLNILPGIGLISRFYTYFAFASLAGFGIIVKNEKDYTMKILFVVSFVLFSIWSFYLLTCTPYFNSTYNIYNNILFY